MYSFKYLLMAGSCNCDLISSTKTFICKLVLAKLTFFPESRSGSPKGTNLGDALLKISSKTVRGKRKWQKREETIVFIWNLTG